MCRGLDCLLLPGQELRGGPGCLILPAKGLHGGPGYPLLLLAKDCTEDLAVCFSLCMNFAEDLDAYFCLPTRYRKDMVADMNYSLVVLVLPCRNMEEELFCNKMVVLVLPCRDVEGGALLQQDDGAVLPQHGQERVTRG